MMSAVSLSQTSGPPLIRFLQNEFGFRGATLILGAITFHSCVGACFYHPVEWYMKKPRRRQVVEHTQEEVIITPENNEANGCMDRKNYAANNKLTANDYNHINQDSNMAQENVSLPVLKISETVHVGISVSESIKETEDIFNDEQREEIHTKEPRRPSSKLITVIHVIRSISSNIKVMRSLRVCIIVIAHTLFNAGTYNVLMMAPFSLQADGHSLDEAAWCLSVYSICNLSRLLMSALSDCTWFNLRFCYMASYFTAFFSVSSKLFLGVFLNLKIKSLACIIHGYKTSYFRCRDYQLCVCVPPLCLLYKITT